MSDFRTDWQVEPSFKFDVLCFLNTLSGDPFYLNYYQAEYDKFASRLPTNVVIALKSLKTKLKDEAKTIISAQLCLILSASQAETLDELIEEIRDQRRLKAAFSQTIYYDDKMWQEFESVKAELITIFTFLKTLNFENYWQEKILPEITGRVNSLKADLAKYDVVSRVEEKLGAPLASQTIVVYVLYYTKPHGIKITGTRFITAAGWSTEVAVRTSAHEMMHPPFDLARNPTLQQAIEELKQDEFLMEVFLAHNPSFGYNTIEGLIDEDSVQALDQLIGENLGVAAEPRKRWRENDEGLHVFAVCLYSVLREEGYGTTAEKIPFEKHLLELMQTRLRPGQLKPVYDRFYASSGEP